ncbi:MAG: RNA-binding S4 domain-containing protein [Clostridia bacterium]|nr:RNA-binding S4 domain-containing protein [Clostridia bacterium]
MRIDKYLKVSRLIKRRTVAAEAANIGRIKINGRTAKPSSDVGVGDIVEIVFGEKSIKLRVESVAEHATKETASTFYTVLEG